MVCRAVGLLLSKRAVSCSELYFQTVFLGIFMVAVCATEAESGTLTFHFSALVLDSKMNLDDFIGMNPRVGWGSVLPLSDFVRQFGRQTHLSCSVKAQ